MEKGTQPTSKNQKIVTTLKTNQNTTAKSKITNKTTDKSAGIVVNRLHTSEDQNPLDYVNYVNKSAKISNPDGSILFEMDNAQVPDSWSQLSTDIAVSKYFRKAGVPKTGHENSIRQLIYRVAHTIRNYGERNSYFTRIHDADSFEAELSYLLLSQRGAFNSPVWFNCGLNEVYGIKGSGGNYYWNAKTDSIEQTNDNYANPQCSACFIQNVDDDLMSIFELGKNEAKIFKYGSGTGTNFSKIRGETERLSGGGYSSGLMSFLSVLDRGAGATKSGGTTRRAAKMVCMDVDHPEIMNFIQWKSKEEKKVAAMVAAGYSSDFNGEAYRTVGGQNSNNSVRVSDEFMHAVEEDQDWSTTLRTNKEINETFKAREIFNEIANSAWECADPGLQFDTTINSWHTCPQSGRINASNPCSEYMFLDDSACNLASINLIKYLNEDGTFDVDGFRHACSIFILAQEILVDLASYPTSKIAENSHRYRTLGLGYANLGTLLMVKGIPYDSDEGRAWAGVITAIMQGEAYKTSSMIAAFKEPFYDYKTNKTSMEKVVARHLSCVEDIPRNIPDYLINAAKKSLKGAVSLGRLYGFRNAQVTVLAPTGTIGLLMDCDTTGIEPDFALVKYKKLAGGGYFKIVNSSVPLALERLGYSEEQRQEMITYILGKLNLDNTPIINRNSLLEKGLAPDDIDNIEKALPSAFSLDQAFNLSNISKETLTNWSINKETGQDSSFKLLNYLGFQENEIEKAEEIICGQMTLEGAPHVKEEHLPIFDCANPCGKNGKRYLSPESHLKMMAAVQPFISGAISKTVNLPNHATVQQVKDLYMQSWKLGLKAVALYRDGCKMSQPLSSNNKKENSVLSSDDLKKLDLSGLGKIELESLITKVLDRMEELNIKPNLMRHRLPKKRQGFTVEAKVGNNKVYLRTGEYDNNKLGEIFIDMHKEGASFRSLLNCFAIAVSKGLQYGVPLEEFVNIFTFTRFEPYGIVEHENIKSATSVVDFIFRVLGMEYLERTDFVHIKPQKRQPEEESNESINRDKKPEPSDNNTSNNSINSINSINANSPNNTTNMYESFMGDAPPCSDCGHTTIRNGSCYKCLNCGNSMGCS